MSDFNRGVATPGSVARPDMAVDAGLRAFMLGVYNKVGLGLVISAALAWVTGTYQPVHEKFVDLALLAWAGGPPASALKLIGAHASILAGQKHPNEVKIRIATALQ